MREWFACLFSVTAKFTTAEARLHAELWSKMQRFQRIGRRQLEPIIASMRGVWNLWMHYAHHGMFKLKEHTR